MITRLKGKCIQIGSDYAVIDVMGIAYEVQTTKLNVKIGDEASIWTYLHVGSDNQPALYGFSSYEERELFETLLKVPGVGPKSAHKILESGNASDIQKAILEKDITYFTRVKGLGKKGAQKIILELRNTLVDSLSDKGGKTSTIEEALQSLGFTSREIKGAVSKVDIENISEEEALEKVLRLLGK